jgi:hypothetical protein
MSSVATTDSMTGGSGVRVQRGSRSTMHSLEKDEGTRTLMPAVREVIESRGVFCALYSDRAPFLRDTKGWRKGGPESVDTVGTGATRAGDQNDSGVFAAGAGADVRRSCKLMILNKLVALTGIEQVNGQPWQAELGLSGCKYVRLVLVALP